MKLNRPHIIRLSGAAIMLPFVCILLISQAFLPFSFAQPSELYTILDLAENPCPTNDLIRGVRLHSSGVIVVPSIWCKSVSQGLISSPESFQFVPLKPGAHSLSTSGGIIGYLDSGGPKLVTDRKSEISLGKILPNAISLELAPDGETIIASNSLGSIYKVSTEDPALSQALLPAHPEERYAIRGVADKTVLIQSKGKKSGPKTFLTNHQGVKFPLGFQVALASDVSGTQIAGLLANGDAAYYELGTDSYFEIKPSGAYANYLVRPLGIRDSEVFGTLLDPQTRKPSVGFRWDKADGLRVIGEASGDKKAKNVTVNSVLGKSDDGRLFASVTDRASSDSKFAWIIAQAGIRTKGR